MQDSHLSVSIITICLNSESTIEITINSVISQTYPHIEYIIIDGGSTDNTLEIIQQYRSKIHLFISEKEKIYTKHLPGFSIIEQEFKGTDENSPLIYATE